MGVVTATTLRQGEAMDPAYALLSLEVSKELNRVPAARLVLADGDVAQGEFPISNSTFFEPGKEIEIKLRFKGDEDVSVFNGLVMRQAVQARRQDSQLTVDLKDAAVKLTQVRHCAVFRNLSDGEILGSLIEGAGLGKGEIATTEPKHPELVQYYAMDWDFMLSRAEICGLMVLVDDGSIALKSVDLTGEGVHRFEFGLSELYDFEFELDATHQQAAIDSVAWDIENQQITEANAAQAFSLAQGNLEGPSLAETLGFDSYLLSHTASLDPAECQGWADARLLRSRLSLLRGRLSVRGNASDPVVGGVVWHPADWRSSGRVGGRRCRERHCPPCQKQCRLWSTAERASYVR
jgi:phage protein D